MLSWGLVLALLYSNSDGEAQLLLAPISHITPCMHSVIRKGVRGMRLTLPPSGVYICACPYLARWHFGSTVRYYWDRRRCVRGYMGHKVTKYCRGKVGRWLLMFTGALGNTYSADSAIVRIWASVIVLTSSWTSILPRNISNRPKHSHLPLRSPRICLPSFLLPLFNHLSFSFLYRFPVIDSCFHFAFKVSFLSFEKGPVMLFVSF